MTDTPAKTPMDLHLQIQASQTEMRAAITPLAQEIVEIVRQLRETPGYIRLSEIAIILPPGENVTARLNDLFQVLNMAPLAIAAEFPPPPPPEMLTPAALKTPEQ